MSFFFLFVIIFLLWAILLSFSVCFSCFLCFSNPALFFIYSLGLSLCLFSFTFLLLHFSFLSEFHPFFFATSVHICLFFFLFLLYYITLFNTKSLYFLSPSHSVFVSWFLYIFLSPSLFFLSLPILFPSFLFLSASRISLLLCLVSFAKNFDLLIFKNIFFSSKKVKKRETPRGNLFLQKWIKNLGPVS